MTEADLEGLGALVAISALNGEIQAYMSERGAEVPSDLIKQLSDLDWTVRNAFVRKREAVQRELRRRGAGEEGYRFLGTSVREQAERAWRGIRERLAHPEPAGAEKSPRREEEERSGPRLLDGWVWCEVHGEVHLDTTDPYPDRENCDALDRRDLYVREQGRET